MPIEKTLLVSEIFAAHQGEGATVGRAAIFIRLAGCNRNCVWCDSKFTWDKAKGRYMFAKDIMAQIEKYPNIHRVIFTGGEPLLQQNAKELALLLGTLRYYDYTIEMESNGDITPNVVVRQHVDQFNISPKLKHAGGRPMRLEQLQYWMTRTNAIIKIVVQTEEDIVAVVKMYRDSKCSPTEAPWRDRLFVMPEGATKDLHEARCKALTDRCLQEGLNMCVRSHIVLWDGERER
jgi:7-carboxy-7-deazaguanine synthase